MHDHPTNDEVIAVLKQVAKEKKKTYKQIKTAFVVKQHQGVTTRFWEIVYEKHPDRVYSGVYHIAQDVRALLGRGLR